MHFHDHPHDHGHGNAHGHDHSRSPGWAVKVALVVTLGLVVTEFVVGTLSHSLSLISDGWHNLSDLPTLILSWIALYFESKPPDEQKTYGYQRAGVLASFVNSLLLVGVALLICYEGYERIVNPQSVATKSMLIVGVVAFLINGGISFSLHSWRSDLNMRAVFIHNLGDALSNVAIVAGAWLIARTGRTWIDPLIAFLIAAMIVWSAVGIIRDSANILLESLPKGMELERVAGVMLEVEGVRGVHDVHIWSLGSRSHALSCHLNILDMRTSETEIIAERVRARLHDRFGIYHATIQFEHTHLPGECHTYMPGPVPAERK